MTDNGLSTLKKRLSRDRISNILDSKGFSLVELLVVIAIIGLLGAIGTPQLLGMRAKSSVRSDARDVHSSFRRAQTRAIKSYEDTCVYVDKAEGKYGIYVSDDGPATYSAKQLRSGNLFILAADYFSLCFNPRGLPSESGSFELSNTNNLVKFEVQIKPAGHVSSSVSP